jgi:hypothetical protein
MFRCQLLLEKLKYKTGDEIKEKTCIDSLNWLKYIFNTFLFLSDLPEEVLPVKPKY